MQRQDPCLRRASRSHHSLNKLATRKVPLVRNTRVNLKRVEVVHQLAEITTDPSLTSPAHQIRGY